MEPSLLCNALARPLIEANPRSEVKNISVALCSVRGVVDRCLAPQFELVVVPVGTMTEHEVPRAANLVKESQG